MHKGCRKDAPGEDSPQLGAWLKISVDRRPGVVMEISPRIISVHHIRIYFGYEQGTHIQNAL